MDEQTDFREPLPLCFPLCTFVSSVVKVFKPTTEGTEFHGENATEEEFGLNYRQEVQCAFILAPDVLLLEAL